MRNNAQELSQKKIDALLEAIFTLQKAEPVILLQDLKRLELMAMEHYLMDNKTLRVSVYHSNNSLQVFLQKMLSILEDTRQSA